MGLAPTQQDADPMRGEAVDQLDAKTGTSIATPNQSSDDGE